MKGCRECRREYYEETLSFCLDEGTTLLVGPGTDETKTKTLGVADANHEPKTEILPSEGATKLQISETGETVILPTDEIKKMTRKSSLFTKKLWVGAAFVGVLAVCGFVGYKYLTPIKQIESIAVMPFVNETKIDDLEYLSDGMTETLISSLSQLPNLSVKARSSVFRYKGKQSDIQLIGKELNVQAILNGRVSERDDKLTLSLELVDVETENAFWSHQYNRDKSELVSLQSEIARDVSAQLQTKLSGEDAKKLGKNYTENAEAYQLYLKGRFHWNKRKPEEHWRAIKYFEQAIALDPKYALAYSGIADGYAVESSPLKGEPRYTAIRSAANKALELDPSLGQPHAALASVYWNKFEWAAAEREFRSAIELDPNYPSAHQWYSELLTRLGRNDEAISEVKRARDLDPLSLIINSDMIYILNLARRHDEAIIQGKKTLEMDSTWNWAHYHLATAYEYKGMIEKSIAEEVKALKYSELTPEEIDVRKEQFAKAKTALESSGVEGYWRTRLEFEKSLINDPGKGSPYYMAIIYSYLNEKDESFKWLNVAIDRREPPFDTLKVEPAFENLRSDPSFKEMLKRINLPD